jgi:hypothetical protein
MRRTGDWPTQRSLKTQLLQLLQQKYLKLRPHPRRTCLLRRKAKSFTQPG